MARRKASTNRGTWTSAQWYSNERLNDVPRYWAPNDSGLITHLAYITEEEVALLKQQAKKEGKPLATRQGPAGVPFFADSSVRILHTSAEGDTANDVPVKWKSSPKHPIARLVYVTDAQAEFLKKMDIHGSGVDEHDHYGPDNVPSYQGDGGGGEGGGGSEGGAGDAGMGSDFGSTGNFGAGSGYEGGVDYGGGSSFGMTGNFGFGSGILGSDANADAAVNAAIDAQTAADFQAAMDAANATTSSGLTAAQAAAYGANEMSATDMDAVGAALAAGASPMSATDIDTATDAIANALSQNADLAQMGQAELDAIAQSLAESGVGKGFSFSNLTLSNVLSALAIAAGKASPAGAIAGLLGIAAKGFGDKGLAQASQVVGLISSVVSGNLPGVISSIGGLTNSPGLATTGALAGLVNAFNTGNLPGVLTAAGQITGITGLSQVGNTIGAMNAAQQGNVLGAVSGLLGATGLGKATLGQLASGEFSVGNLGALGALTDAQQDAVVNAMGGDAGGPGVVDSTTATALANMAPASPTPVSPLSAARSAPTTAAQTASATAQGALPVGLEASSLIAGPSDIPTTTMDYKLPQLSQSLVDVDPKLMQIFSSRSSTPSYYSYGQSAGDAQPSPLMATRISSMPGPQMPVRATSNPYDPMGGLTSTMSPSGITNTGMGLLAGSPLRGYAKGGYNAHEGHNPQFITGKTGYYVRGAGDGQSDSIPAMLADGEYVFDADTVAALGNGSSDAGARVLDKMRENIRKHKRSAKPGDIPPPAKSPLAYMKG